MGPGRAEGTAIPEGHPKLRIAAVGDLHVRETPSDLIRQLVSDLADAADVLVLCGDLTDRGLPREADALAEALAAHHFPIVAVLGNHDYESGHQEEVARILTHAGVTMLQDGPCDLRGVGFAGVKGFAGGFDGNMLQPWGEEIIKQFVQEAVTEAMHLEGALARLRAEQRATRMVAAFHYSPIRRTVEGERVEIIPFLGSSRLADPLDRFGVAAVFHAHAHYGSMEGRTPGGIPVYNVSLPVLRQTHGEQPYMLIEL